MNPRVEAERRRVRALFPGDAEMERVAVELAENADQPVPVLTRLADVKPERVRWLWPERIPLGKMTILDGDPGLGKSLLGIDIAARVTTNNEMPDGTRSDLANPAGVVILSAEDDPADTIRPRFDTAGGDASRVVLLQAIRERVGDEGERVKERSVTLADLPALKAAIASVSAKLVIIDPVMAYIGGTDAHRDSEIRGLLAPLARLAAETGAAIVLVRHLRKTPTANPLYAGGGSIGIVGAVRSGMMVALDPDDDETGETRVLAQTKSNLSRCPASISYRIVEIDGAPAVAWGGESAHDARTLLAAQGEDDSERDEPSSVTEAVNFLLDLLKGGPVAVKEIQAAARAACITAKTLRNAKEALGIKASRDGFGSRGGWRWSLSTDAQHAEGAPLAPLVHSANGGSSPKEALLDSVGTLGGETAPVKVEIEEDIPF